MPGPGLGLKKYRNSLFLWATYTDNSATVFFENSALGGGALLTNLNFHREIWEIPGPLCGWEIPPGFFFIPHFPVE